MNSKQKLVQAQFLNNEAAVITRLLSVYKRSQKDINDKIQHLTFNLGQLQAEFFALDDTDPQKAEIKSQIQSKIYQKQYQEQLKKQIDGILNEMQVKQFTTVSEYLDTCYTDGFIGTVFDLHGQGIPLIMPINQESMVTAVQLDSKISEGLYNHLNEDVQRLKNVIAAMVSRGISSGMNYYQVAQQISMKMLGTYENAGGSLAYAKRIARTEGHRIQVQAAMDACYSAQERGADIVKQWDSTLDGRTRTSHRHVDGEIRELDEKFSNGLRFPGDPSGKAAEVIHCRCALLQRAKWALDDDELEELKQRAEYFGLDKSDTFDDFKQKYLEAAKPEAKPKKEYLTKKKLQEKIADLDKQIGATTDPDQLQALEALKADYQSKLDKKIVAAETKKLKKEQTLVQDQIDAYPIETYSGIWKDDVTTSDWAAKKAAIPKKKAYFEQQLQIATGADVDKWQGLLDSLDDFDQKGAEYYALKQQLAAIQSDLTKLQKNGIMSSAGLDTFSQAQKDAALWFDAAHGGFGAADSYFDPPSKAIHGSATPKEHDGFYTYTRGSGGHNRPLAGFRKPWSESGSGWEERFFVGPHQVWIDFEGKGEQIRGLTTLIQRSIYNQDVWLQSGQDFQTLEGFLKIPYGTLSSMSDAELQQFVGYTDIMYSFISTAVNGGGGSIFNEKPMKINFFAPSGTQMLYASDVGAFGKGENEMILQRGGTYRISRIYWGTDDTDGGKQKIFVDMEIHPEAGYDLFQQDPAEWTGSTKNYHD